MLRSVGNPSLIELVNDLFLMYVEPCRGGPLHRLAFTRDWLESGEGSGGGEGLHLSSMRVRGHPHEHGVVGSSVGMYIRPGFTKNMG